MHFPFITISVTSLQAILYIALDDKSISQLQYEHPNFLQVWRLFTYTFVEKDPRNLILNLPAQLLLGFLLEYFHVWWKVIALYFGGSVMAALGSSFLDKSVPLVGSSPGVLAFAFSCLAEAQLCSGGNGRYKQLRLAGIFYLVLAEAFRTLMGFLGGTGLAVHSFGAIAGYLLGSALFSGDVNSVDTQNTFRIVGALYYAFFLIVLLILNLFFI